MISPKALQLVETLYNKTISDEISWSETADNGVYQIAYPNFAIKIVKVGLENYEDIKLQIFNQYAVLIEEITDDDLSQFENYYPPEAYNFMNRLYNKARSQALGVEQVINEIINQLQSGDRPTADDDIPF